MRKLSPICLAALALLTPARAQEVSGGGEGPVVATIRQLKGTCYVKEGEAGKPRKLKGNEQLRAGEELSCAEGGRLVITFRGSSSEKEIKKTLPKWYVLPNVPAPEALSPLTLAGRPKNGPDGPAAQGGTPVGGRQNAAAAGPTLTRNTGIDEADLSWRSREKYFLVVAASKTAGANTDLPFTRIDARLVGQTLAEKGYQKLDILDEEQATRDNLVERLKTIRSLPENAVVVVYYSGHAAKDPQDKDLWLQLYGQAGFGDHHGLSLSGLVGAARGGGFKGDLVIILDSCYSGQATVASQLSLRETSRTVIFASSASSEPSYSVRLQSGAELSAFTYFLLRGLGPDWAEADGDEDGIILYSDLQSYVENKLLELLRDKLIRGSMQPQLFGQSPKIWAAYDRRMARNLESQVRKTLRLERSARVEDPETTLGLVEEMAPPPTDPYSRALLAIKAKRFEDAWRLLDAAEGEKTLPSAQIIWARAYLKSEQGQLGAARDLYEKALILLGEQNLSISSKDRSGLTLMAAMMNFGLGDLVRAEQLFKQTLDLIGDSKDKTDELVGALFALTIVDFLQGKKAEARRYLGELMKIDRKALEELDQEPAVLLPILEILSDLIENKTESAKRKIEALRVADAASAGGMQEGLRSLLQNIDMYIVAADTGGTAVVITDKLKEWDEAIRSGNVNFITLLLTQIQVATLDESELDLLNSQQVGSLLKQTVELARRNLTDRQRAASENTAGPGEDDVAERLLRELETANLLARAAALYESRRELPEAESLLKEVIGLFKEDSKGVSQQFNPVLALGGLYEDAGRFADAEKVYTDFLNKLQDPFGDKNLFTYAIYSRLGGLYENWRRWDEAEKSYRKAVQTQSAPGGMFLVEGQENLAYFLYNRERYSEAVPLYEEIINTLERAGGVRPFDDDRSAIGYDYYRLAQGYYRLGRHAAAQKAFEEAYKNFTSQPQPDLIDILSCLVWQWFTADALKKPDEADRYYQRAVQFAESDLARPQPNKWLGSNLQTFASWYRDEKAFTEAERFLKLAFAVQEKVYGPQSTQLAEVWESYGYLSNARLQYGNSIDHFENAFKIQEKQAAPDFEKLSTLLYWSGLAKYERQDLEGASADLQRALDTLKRIPQPSRPRHVGTEFLLGEVRRVSGRYDDAENNYISVIKWEEQRRRDASTFADLLAVALLRMAATSRARGNRAEAEQWLARAQKELDNPNAAQCVSCFAMLAHEKGMLAAMKGDAGQAEQLLREAVDKAEKVQTASMLLAEYIDSYATVLSQLKKDEEADRQRRRAKQLRYSLKNLN